MGIKEGFILSFYLAICLAKSAITCCSHYPLCWKFLFVSVTIYGQKSESLASFTCRTCLVFPSLSLQPCHLLCVMPHYACKINWLLCVGWQLYHWIQFWTETSVYDQRRRTAAQSCTAGFYQSFRAGRWRCLSCRWWNVWFRLELGHGCRCAILHGADSAVIMNLGLLFIYHDSLWAKLRLAKHSRGGFFFILNFKWFVSELLTCS